MRYCVKGGFIVDPVNNYEGRGTIWIEDHKIVCVETLSGSTGITRLWTGGDGYKTIDAKGKWILPGLIDLHTHLRDPGFEHKENILSGCDAAKKGGYTKICCMPNTKPVVDCKEVAAYIKNKAASVKGIEVFVIGAITKGQMGETLTDIDELYDAGVCALSEDGKSVTNAKLMRGAMIKARELGIPVISHAEDENLAGLPIGEELIVARDILLAGETGCKLHLCHISTEGSVKLIRKAKEEGLPVTAETAPHYFTLTKNNVKKNTNRKMNPPLRSMRDVDAIKSALKDGTIDAIATDHAPHSKNEKDVDFEYAPNGVIGLETSFAAGYTYLVKTGVLTNLELINRMSSRPAGILGIKPPSISAGEPANFIMVDVDNEYTVRSDGFVSKSANSPFIGMNFYGRVFFPHEIWE